MNVKNVFSIRDSFFCVNVVVFRSSWFFCFFFSILFDSHSPIYIHSYSICHHFNTVSMFISLYSLIFRFVYRTLTRGHHLWASKFMNHIDWVWDWVGVGGGERESVPLQIYSQSQSHSQNEFIHIHISYLIMSFVGCFREIQWYYLLCRSIRASINSIYASNWQSCKLDWTKNVKSRVLLARRVSTFKTNWLIRHNVS